MKKIKAALLLVVLVTLVASSAAAAPAKQGNPTTLHEFLLWLSSAGAVIAVSWIFEQTGWFQDLPANQKKWLMYALSAAVGVVALLVQRFVPADVLVMLEPYFTVLLAVFGMIFINQAAHALDPQHKE